MRQFTVAGVDTHLRPLYRPLPPGQAWAPLVSGTSPALREIDATPPALGLRPAWFTARVEDNLIGTLACVLIAVIVASVAVMA